MYLAQLTPILRVGCKRLALLLALALPVLSTAMELALEPAPAHCGKPVPSAASTPTAAALTATVPAAAAQRLAGSHAVQGQRDIAWAWLGSPTARYPHTALGSRIHAGSLHVLASAPGAAPNATGAAQELVYRLPINRVFEDLTVRLVDIDQDGRDEVIVIEADALRGASLVVLGLEDAPSGKTIVERARSAPAGSTFRWLNPVGVADFDGDGKLDIAAVITPHIGGVLTLYHYRPPQLVAYARAMDTSNHLMGSPEQQLSVILQQSGQRPTIIVPDMGLKALHALRWEGNGASANFKELADVMPLPARVQRISLLPDTPGAACVELADHTWHRVTLKEFKPPSPAPALRPTPGPQ